MKVKAYELNAFAKSFEGGNAAGVVLHADSLSEEDMKKIAGVLGHSETAFVSKSEAADFKVRFFTPTEEVDLCGHATIGTFYLMAHKGLIQPGLYRQETKAGILDVLVEKNHQIMMTQTAPEFFQIIDREEVAASLNISIADLPEDLPVQIVSTGLKDIIVPIKNIKTLHTMMPNMARVEEISRKYDVVGYHVFTLETLNNGTAHCRNFAPLYGIPEESATGTSNGALSCYLYKYGKLNDEQAQRIIIEQGYSMGKPSEIQVSLVLESNEIQQVKVGGGAMNLREVEVEY